MLGFFDHVYFSTLFFNVLKYFFFKNRLKRKSNSAGQLSHVSTDKFSSYLKLPCSSISCTDPDKNEDKFVPSHCLTVSNIDLFAQ